MNTAELLQGLLAQAVAGEQAAIGRINALIYAKASGLTAADLGETNLLVINPPVPPPPSAPAPAAAVPAAPSFDFFEIVEQQQPDGTWREIERTPITPS